MVLCEKSVPGFTKCSQTFMKTLQILVCTLLHNVILTQCTNNLNDDLLFKQVIVCEFMNCFVIKSLTKLLVTLVYFTHNNLLKQFTDLHELLTKIHELGRNFLQNTRSFGVVRNFDLKNFDERNITDIEKYLK